MSERDNVIRPLTHRRKIQQYLFNYARSVS